MGMTKSSNAPHSQPAPEADAATEAMKSSARTPISRGAKSSTAPAQPEHEPSGLVVLELEEVQEPVLAAPESHPEREQGKYDGDALERTHWSSADLLGVVSFRSLAPRARVGRPSGALSPPGAGGATKWETIRAKRAGWSR